MKRKILISALLLSSAAFAQDPHLSQYYALPMALNPATTGMHSDEWRAHLHYRSQWGNLIKNPFVTSAAAFDMPYEKFGFGAYILNNRAGTGNFNALNFVLSSAYEITIDPNKIHHFTTGVQLGFIQKSVNSNNLTWDNQYNSSTGDFDKSIGGEDFSKQRFIAPEVNFGLQYSHTAPNSKFKPYFGVAAFHLTQPKETFMGMDNKLPLRFISSGGTSYKINQQFSAEGNFLYQRQVNNNEVQMGALAFYTYEEKKMTFFAGPYYRNKDAVVIHTGIVYGEYTFRMSYDVNVSPLNALMGRSAGFEFSVTYVKKKGTYIPSIL